MSAIAHHLCLSTRDAGSLLLWLTNSSDAVAIRTHHRLAYVSLFQHRKESSMNASMAVVRFISIFERKFFKDVYTAVIKVDHLIFHYQTVQHFNSF